MVLSRTVRDNTIGSRRTDAVQGIRTVEFASVGPRIWFGRFRTGLLGRRAHARGHEAGHVHLPLGDVGLVLLTEMLAA
jgi:hypothetical protein